MAKFNAERSATILADASLTTDAIAARKWGITPKSIYNWRERLETDPLFSELFIRKREALVHDWLGDAPIALRSAIDFIKRAAELGNPEDPDQVKAVNEAFKTLTEVVATKQVLDARITQQVRS